MERVQALKWIFFINKTLRGTYDFNWTFKRTRESLFGDNYFMFIAFLEQLKT